jgi:hypothetical protein
MGHIRVADKSRWDVSASRTYPRCGWIPQGLIPLGLIRFADLSTMWMYPEGTYPKGSTVIFSLILLQSKVQHQRGY